MAIFASIKTSVVAVAAGATFFILYLISKFTPSVQSAMAEPGENRGSTFLIIGLITLFFSLSMGLTSLALPMYDVVNNSAQEVVNNIY
jgi:hypothetical protein